MFHIGDRVRFVDDPSNENWSIVNIYTSINKVQVFSKNQNVAKVVDPSAIVSTDTDEIKQAIREVLLSDEFLSAFAKAFVNTPMPSTIQPVSDLSKGLVKAWTCEDSKAKQVYPEPKWTPQVGDWVKIKKPADTQSSACIWVESMNKYDGQVIEVKQLAVAEGILHDNWGFMFEWLEPAKQPIVKQSLTTEPDPGKGYRLLSKDPPEKLLDTDEGLFACGLNGQQWLSVNYSSGEQLPSVYYRRKIDAETLKQSPQPPDGWRWLEVGEVIRKGDKLLDGNSWFNYPASVEAVLWDDASPSIRRNRFSIGEKVVDHFKGRIGIVKGPTGSVENPSEYEVEMLDTKRTRYFFPFQLAPYIEEAT